MSEALTGVQPKAPSAKRTKLGKRIRAERERQALSQEVLAVRAGIGVATLRRLEKGRHAPRKDTLAAVALALGVEVDKLRAA